MSSSLEGQCRPPAGGLTGCKVVLEPGLGQAPVLPGPTSSVRPSWRTYGDSRTHACRASLRPSPARRAAAWVGGWTWPSQAHLIGPFGARSPAPRFLAPLLAGETAQTLADPCCLWPFKEGRWRKVAEPSISLSFFTPVYHLLGFPA